jgi:hypothetical protein
VDVHRGKGRLYSELRRLDLLTCQPLEAKVNTCKDPKALSMRSSHLGAESPPPLSRFG